MQVVKVQHGNDLVLNPHSFETCRLSSLAGATTLEDVINGS
ncbi:unnamed protein product [Rhodiola kirilowii]